MAKRDWNKLSAASKRRYLTSGRNQGLSPQKVVGLYRSGGDIRGLGGKLARAVSKAPLGSDVSLWVATEEFGYILVQGLTDTDRGVVGDHMHDIRRWAEGELAMDEFQDKWRGVWVGGYRYTRWRRTQESDWSRRTGRKYVLMWFTDDIEDWYDRDLPTPHESIYER